MQNLVYARTDIGGLYRSTDGGNTWVPLLDWVGWDNWGCSGVGAVAVDPQNAGTVYAAVGGYTNAWDPNNGAIIKSTDQGATWQPGMSLNQIQAIDACAQAACRDSCHFWASEALWTEAVCSATAPPRAVGCTRSAATLVPTRTV